MPAWAHLPLILKPDGHGKLSKRDGERLGFPVFPINWTDPNTGEQTKGFREMGFLPEAFVNMLSMLGWHSGEEKEIYSLNELITAFNIERVHKGGAKFDFEKAKWYNQQWIKLSDNTYLLSFIKPLLASKGIEISDDSLLLDLIDHVKERCTLGTELEFVIMVIAVSCVKLLSAHNSTQHTSRKHKV
jgi:glutamyl-tRNA synthetase (EC 6.1.1.17)